MVSFPALSLEEWQTNFLPRLCQSLAATRAVLLIYDAGEDAFLSLCGQGIPSIDQGLPLKLKLDQAEAAALFSEKIILDKSAVSGVPQLKSVEKFFQQTECVSGFSIPAFQKVAALVLWQGAAAVQQDQVAALRSSATSALESIFSTWLGQEYVGEWLHDLRHPFGSKGSLPKLKAALKDEKLSEPQRALIQEAVKDLSFLENYVHSLLSPVQDLPVALVNNKPRIFSHVWLAMQEKFSQKTLEKNLRWNIIPPPYTTKILCDLYLMRVGVWEPLLNYVAKWAQAGSIVAIDSAAEKNFIAKVRWQAQGEGAQENANFQSVEKALEAQMGTLSIHWDGATCLFKIVLPLA